MVGFIVVGVFAAAAQAAQERRFFEFFFQAAADQRIIGADFVTVIIFLIVCGPVFVGGAVFIFVAVLLYYRLAGLNAILALILNAVMLLGAMALFGATLTLPGIAGFILTIGMAVDSNVLIFERIREELRAGRAPKTAIENGFSKAFATIIDTHLTVIISAIFLFQFGTGPVKGFAVTLILGLLISVFTAVFVSHTIFELMYGRRQHIDALSI